MTAIQSRSRARLGTSYPASMTFLLGETAAESSHPLGLKASLSSLTKAAKASLSEAGPLSQLTCQHLGYSQSKSRPSNSYFSMKSMTCEMNLALAAGLLTMLLYLGPRESFQPPRAMVTLSP